MIDSIYKLLNNTKNETDFEENQLSDMEVNNIMKRFQNENNSDRSQKITHKNRRIIAGTASVAAVAVLIPTSVYAYNRISASIQKTAPYQNTVKIDSLNNEDTPDAAPLSEGYMTWNLGYLPEGYEYDSEKFEFKYNDSYVNSGLSLCFYRIPETMDNFEVDLSNSARCENYESNGNTAMINYRIGYEKRTSNSEIPGREVWIYFGDTRYVLQLTIGNEISQDDLYKIIDNASLVPSNEQRFGEYFPWLDDSNNADKEYFDSTFFPISPDECNIVQIGETGDYHVDSSLNCSFTINSAEITDSFDGITKDTSGNPTDFSEYMDENGNILPNTRTWFTVGDGVNTIDEDIESVDMPFHILKLNVTAVNYSDEQQEIGICPDLISFNSDSVPMPFEIDDNVPNGYENLRVRTIYDSELDFSDSLLSLEKEEYISANNNFSFNTDDTHKGDKNSLRLDAGESVDFEVCFMISDNSIGKTYLQFYRIGNSESSSFRKGYPLYDLTEIKIK